MSTISMETPRLISVNGWSGTGKTTFIEAAVAECRARGIPAACVKKSRHEADLPPDTKDSSRFFAAGASPSLFLGQSSMLTLSPPPEKIDEAALAALCGGAAIVFCEGLEIPGAYRIVVGGDASSEEEIKRPFASVDCVVSRNAALSKQAACAGKFVLGPDGAKALLDMLYQGGSDHGKK